MREAGIAVLIFACCLFYSATAEAGVAKLAKEAKRLYLDEKYGEAAEKYKEALNLDPDSDIIHFDAGAALYKKEDYGNAIGESQKALSTKSESLEAKSNYNIGNSKYRLGRLEESLDYYKRAIELDARDEDAKFNYEFVEKKLKENQDQKKQQKPSPQQDKEKEKQKEKEKPRKKQKKKEEKEKKEEKPEGKKPEEPKADRKENEKQDRKEDEKHEQKDEQSAPQAPRPKKGGMSEEETRMLLEGHRHEEESRGDSQKKRIRRLPEVLKDW